ncbi:Flagellin [Sodalis glossinidius str. 'morsitans']|uniref:Flagellin n=1 Tax=Sodalis glossinidius (strain morsitans) TaxID=343509 RepID=Q2NWZ2_SODGM|nr:FliC/FljB family flagellin [Sodalis glossinidius]BAE73333.1 flagellin FliC [Sodalis glossinidius str. 'morsitans']CRL43652.1 Flagellin [Sodalis glossinidius str. 'morsitans']
MSQVINTNILSITAQNNLNKSQNSLSTAIQRLSSGLRINSAKDDAAGQAISNRFTSLINGLTQASRNANDGIAVAQTAEGAINEINENLQAIRRLTVQVKSTASISDADKKSIQDEIGKRLEEIDRIAEQTEFNGIRILSEDQKLAIQVGANDGQIIDIDLFNMGIEKLGMEGFNVDDGVSVPGKLGSEIKTFTGEVAPSLKGETEEVNKTDKKIYFQDGIYYTKSATKDEYYKVERKGQTSQFEITKAENGIELTSPDTVEKIEATDPVTGLAKGESLYNYTDEKGATTYAIKGQDASGKDVYYAAKYDALTGKATKEGVISTGKDATEDPLKTIDKAIAIVDGARGALGATQNRLGSVINSLSTTVANLSQSRSNIEDADFATEVSNMNRANILQQAGTAVLAQANAVPQGILKLLS